MLREMFRLKTWAGPLTIGSFVVVALTGVLLFFHANVGLNKLAHEWLGWLMVVGGLAHVVLNWQPFVAYFRRPVGLAIIGLMLVLGGLSFMPAGQGGRGHGPRAFMAVAGALENSSLQVLAQVAQTTPDSLLARLRAEGFQVRDAAQTVGEISSANRVRGVELLGLLLASPNLSPTGPSGH